MPPGFKDTQKVQGALKVQRPSKRCPSRDARLGDARLGDARLGDARLRDARLGDARLGDARLGDARLGDDLSSLKQLRRYEWFPNVRTKLQ